MCNRYARRFRRASSQDTHHAEGSSQATRWRCSQRTHECYQGRLRSPEGHTDELYSTWRPNSESNELRGLPRTSTWANCLCRHAEFESWIPAAGTVRPDRVVTPETNHRLTGRTRRCTALHWARLYPLTVGSRQLKRESDFALYSKRLGDAGRKGKLNGSAIKLCVAAKRHRLRQFDRLQKLNTTRPLEAQLRHAWHRREIPRPGKAYFVGLSRLRRRHHEPPTDHWKKSKYWRGHDLRTASK